MKILLGLISSNLWICNKFDKEQGQLVPEELRSDENVFSFKVFNPEKIVDELFWWNSDAIRRSYELFEGKYKNHSMIGQSWKEYKRNVSLLLL